MTEKRDKPAILLISASATTGRLVAKRLQNDYRVETAPDAEQAWERLLDSADISLVICDLQLVIDNFGLLQRLRGASDTPLAATPVLLMVGENDSEALRESAFDAGASDFINLPFASTELIARVRLHVNLYLQHAANPGQLAQQSASAVNLLQQLAQEKNFNARVEQEFSFSRRHHSSIGLCKLKIDNARAIISDFDKATAIGAVKAVASTIQQTLRREDSLCYLGNGEFHLFYPATNGIGAITAVNRIFANVAASKLKIAGKPVRVTLSAAVYSCIADGDTNLDSIYRRLDEGVAAAMKDGGNQVVGASAGNGERLYSIDRALGLIDSGETGDLERHAAVLVSSIVPLLEFAADTLKLDLEPLIDSLRRDLSRDNPERSQ